MLKSTYSKDQPQAPSPAQHVQYHGPIPLPDGWTEHKAPSGHTYYYHAETKKSTYARPVPDVAQAPAPSPFFPSGPQSLLEVHPQAHAHRVPWRGGHRGGHYGGPRGPRREEPPDRPKHTHIIPGCKPWVLVRTKLGRRFVHNPETGESFWKFPENVMLAVIDFDHKEREKQQRRAKGEASDGEQADDDEERDKPGEGGYSQDEAGSGSEYEEMEVEVTDDEDGEYSETGDDGLPSKRQRIEDPVSEGPLEFNEDDLEWQLQQMEEDETLLEGEGDIPPLSNEDAIALFGELLEDYHINPFKTWDAIIEEGLIIEDPRYTMLPNMKSRREAWGVWSREKIHFMKEQREKQEKTDPKISYLAFLQNHASIKLYWPEFKRKYRKEQVMKDSKLSDREREKLYREYVRRLQMPTSALKSDFTALLKSLPLRDLNRSCSTSSLPSSLLTDLKYISLEPKIRDPLIEAYVATLPPAPEADISAEEAAKADAKWRDRKRRERALAEREKFIEEERRKQERERRVSMARLKAEERVLEQAMHVGREGLMAHLKNREDDKSSGAA